MKTEVIGEDDMTISQVIIRINCLALQMWERSEKKTHSMAKYGANPNFMVADAFFSSTKNVCWQVSLPPSRSSYCSSASSHGLMILGHFLNFELCTWQWLFPDRKL